MTVHWGRPTGRGSALCGGLGYRRTSVALVTCQYCQNIITRAFRGLLDSLPDKFPKEEDAQTRYEWIRDCLDERDRVLTGRSGHWCQEWDGMTVDETAEEFKDCICFREQ